MSDAAQTALFAVLVYVIGQTVQKIFLEPYQEQRRLIGETAYTLVYYANISDMALPDEQSEARKAIRKLAAQLRATAWTIPFYPVWAFVRLVPSRKAISEASAGLISISNSVGHGSTREQRDAVSDALKIDWK